MDSEAPLFILYTSGSTGKPKGIIHTTAGYNLYAKKTMEWVFDVRDEDVYWCTADIGWITGHTLRRLRAAGGRGHHLHVRRRARLPRQGRWWDIIEQVPGHHPLHGPDGHPHLHQVGRRVGRTPRPFQPAAAGQRGRRDQSRGLDVVSREDRRRALPDRRYLVADRDGRDHDDPAARRDRRPSPAAAPSRCRALLPEIVGEDRQPVPAGTGGWLVITKPWPGMLRGIWGDDERYKMQYWTDVPGKYLCGDNARCDEDGYYWIMGRIDDVLNVSGHRLSTIEIESALVSHPAVAEAAAVGRPHDIKGEAVAVFVTLDRRLRSDRGAAAGVEEPRPQGDRRLGRARRHPLHRLVAQDPQRQDHAAAAPRHRRRPADHRRHHDAGRFQRAGAAADGRRVNASLNVA